MKFTRRSFLSAAAGASALSAMPPGLAAKPLPARSPSTLDAQGLALEEAAAKPVLRLKGLTAPVIIESIELLWKGRQYFLRVRSKGLALQARSSTPSVLIAAFAAGGLGARESS